MFTGIVEEKGILTGIHRQAESLQLNVRCHQVLTDVHVGDSIAVNGICLTVTRYDAHTFDADVMPETFRSTNLGELRPGSEVNLERALPANGRFGGHIVSGHIDGTGRIVRKVPERNALWLEIQADAGIMKYIVMKGSVALDGTSLTVADVKEGRFAVSLIPHTAEMTVLADKAIQATVNIECDVVAKYVEQLTAPARSNGITMEWLGEQGYR